MRSTAINSERALSNLVENAIKFSEQGSRVTVESEVRESDRQIAIHVKDTGIGIPAEIQSQVFDRFFRGRQRGF
ncbi:MAG: sensor histidine kinase [Chloroflexi bacterium]|nr:sensor histidine kinase [Chloroflexota bacterium]